jgi:hypothetical protein
VGTIGSAQLPNHISLLIKADFELSLGVWAKRVTEMRRETGAVYPQERDEKHSDQGR